MVQSVVDRGRQLREMIVGRADPRPKRQATICTVIRERCWQHGFRARSFYHRRARFNGTSVLRDNTPRQRHNALNYRTLAKITVEHRISVANIPYRPLLSTKDNRHHFLPPSCRITFFRASSNSLKLGKNSRVSSLGQAARHPLETFLG